MRGYFGQENIMNLLEEIYEKLLTQFKEICKNTSKNLFLYITLNFAYIYQKLLSFKLY